MTTTPEGSLEEGQVKSIKGTVTLLDGTEVEFSLSREYSWSKWGAPTEKLYEAGPVVEAMQAAAEPFIRSEYADDDESEEANV